MRLGIIGLPQSGKTTVFNALTRGHQPITTSGGRFDVHTGVVDVPDVRIDRLSAMFKPKKTIYAKVTYADIAGLEGSQSAISGQILNLLTQMDGLLHVVRCFEDANVPHPAGSVNPLRDIVTMDAELLLNDMITVERKLERLAEERKKGGGRERSVIEREIVLFERFKDTLSREIPLREIDLTSEDEKALAGFGFLTRKPLLVLLNLYEGQEIPPVEYPHTHASLVALQGILEMELAQLAPEDAEVFMAEYGISELGLARVIRVSYDLLGLISFFTVGADEVRAWTLRRGLSAYEAAGEIHSDLQKGFIRAEVISYDELLALGGLNEAKAKGRLRLEGKEYLVHDGEIVHIRFNV
ncbi:MAG: redox-regulated ATPase YchF [Anaerolineales bacterium]|nr:redox-regulated ATPase YchF [Anaerolineae bacterium]PWB49941.1 MAG: redox-regulated ATPase YchF [Anaerolineales bacterium]